MHATAEALVTALIQSRFDAWVTTWPGEATRFGIHEHDGRLPDLSRAAKLADIEADFGPESTTTLSWAFTGYAIVAAALLVPAGWAADRFGRRRFLVGESSAFAAATLVARLPGSRRLHSETPSGRATAAVSQNQPGGWL